MPDLIAASAAEWAERNEGEKNGDKQLASSEQLVASEQKAD